MTIPEPQSVVAYLALGSNIAPETNLPAAVRLLRQYCRVTALSPVYRTPPQGFIDQADFYNMAVQIETTSDPEGFKREVLAEIERALGRVRDPNDKNAPRTIDLDIALWGAGVMAYGAKPWHVPDPDIYRFAHVAVPLADLAPDYIHPETGETLAQIAGRFDRGPMQQVALDFDA